MRKVRENALILLGSAEKKDQSKNSVSKRLRENIRVCSMLLIPNSMNLMSKELQIQIYIDSQIEKPLLYGLQSCPGWPVSQNSYDLVPVFTLG